ncbi:murein biosynthesis integral membrane protein MurJ [Bosea sp. BK604]|uniref:murein biosynthesis integral membrane protein MurJ n=1 Tax=Bosea sp. BK604 TaxID=2512180 RepID=UPI001046F43B|nr:murein biosynthesis integral membrane protein MurJ [Bosea sp. BK604]TCR68897.1 putative peptidoglycan lipid II flippase [Bosea sp. BK604]
MEQAEPGARPSRLARDSAIVGVATILSRLLGFARDVLIARLLGAGPVADAFLAALRLPNLVRRVLGEGGLNAPFVPVYLDIKARRGAEDARRFAGEASAQLGLPLILLVALGELFAPWVVLGLAGGFADEPATLALASHYTRLMLPFLLLTTMAALLAALLNAEKHFAIAAIAPALMNAILLLLLLAMLWQGSPPEMGASALAAGVSLTGLAHLAMILIRLRSTGLPRPSLRWSPDMTRLIRTGGATLLAASAAQLVLLVATQIASAEPGSVAALYYADRVFQLPLGFVGVAMGTVVLSDMAAAQATATEHDAMLGRALALGLALAVPAATALAVLSGPIVSVLFEHGRFGAEDRERTEAALRAFAYGLPFAVIAKVFGQVYFARQAPRPALTAGLAAVLIAILAGVSLGNRANAAEIAAVAASLGFLAQAALLTFFLHRDRLWRPSLGNLRPILATLCASAAMLLTLTLILPLLSGSLALDQPIIHRFAALSCLCLGGLAIYGLAGWVLGAFGARPLRSGPR